MTRVINPGRVIRPTPHNGLLRPSQVLGNCRLNGVHSPLVKLVVPFAQTCGKSVILPTAQLFGMTLIPGLLLLLPTLARLRVITAGERSRNSKFSYESPRSIYGETSSEREESASTYPCRLLSGSIQENRVEGVVLVVIQITGDPNAERTAPPRSTHVQPGDVSHALIQQGERERLRKTPSSTSTTAWW